MQLEKMISFYRLSSDTNSQSVHRCYCRLEIHNALPSQQYHVFRQLVSLAKLQRSPSTVLLTRPTILCFSLLYLISVIPL